ncbi:MULTISPECIES: hypothetical protein [Flavobacteriaceae]|uniref:hypothetical protein n=1 Tax=Flavobacteriaceae TaxID=49546 RepID=UPI00234AC78A|nr:hypothetical protein [Muricauda sp. SP22]MDC6364010.1 hypothetical protein [Muricauda sp. SP22]
MEPKTYESYKREILEQYRRENGGEIRGYLSSPTRKQIREACLWLLKRRNWKYDEEILNRFFQFSGEKSKSLQIQQFNPDRFVPIVKFIKGKTNDTSIENLELIAWLIDFKPRPLTIYLNSDNPVDLKEVSKKNESDPNIDFETIEDISVEDIIDKKKKKRRRWVITISIAFATVLLTNLAIRHPIFNSKTLPEHSNQCMAWADSSYVSISCAKKPYSQYGTPIEPLNQIKLENFKRVNVTMATSFFSEDGKPMIWYFKNKDGEIEYYTAPGLHPITGKTLREITPYIIQTYVPPHIERSDSFVQ